MSVLTKRKRGRPRLDESREINDFDASLIAAVKKFPIFYDKNHPHYRNREYTERMWGNVANNLNVSGKYYSLDNLKYYLHKILEII